MERYIYKWSNKINGKVYIGQTINKKRRYNEFKNKNGYYTSNSPDNLSKIDRARIKYGIDNFEYEVLEEFELEDKEKLLDKLNELEEYYVDFYNSVNNGYNTIKGGSSYIHKNRPNKGGRVKLDYKIQNDVVYLPNNFKGSPKLALLYLAIQLYSVDNISSISLDIIYNNTKLSTHTIRKYIEELESLGYLKVNRSNYPIKYIFNYDISNSEPFSYSFLDKKDLSFTEKSYLISTQQYMYKDENEGRVSITNKELSSLIKMSESQISKCNHSLEENGYLEGASEIIKRFKLRELDQLFIWKFKEQDEKIQKNTDDITLLKRELEQMKLENEKMKKLLDIKNTYILT